MIIKLDENVVDIYSDFPIEEGDIDDTSEKDIQDRPEYNEINISMKKINFNYLVYLLN